MSIDFDRRFPSFFIGEHDRITIGGKAMRFCYMTGTSVVLKPVEGQGVAETFDIGQLNRLNAAGQVHHEVEYFLPPHLRSRPVRSNDDVVAPKLSPAHRMRVDIRHAMAMALIALSDESLGKVRVKITDESIEAHMGKICERAIDYLEEEGPNPEAVQKMRDYLDGKGRKPQGGGMRKMPARVNSRTLRKWVKLLQAGGKWALIDQCAKRGNTNSYFTPDENALLMKTVDNFYLDLNRPSIAATVKEVRKAFHKENAARAESGLSAMRIPSREAVRKIIRSLDKFTVLAARFGRQEAMKRMKPVGQGLEVSRPFERVEIDECKIDLITIMSKSGLLTLFTPEELSEFGLDDRTARWWLEFAIDCRTRMIVGMQLTKNPTTSAAIEGLRMAMTPKGAFADAVGALTPWTQAGKPETLVADNGVFKSVRFTDTCAALGIDLLRTIAAAPAMRGMIERLFLTAAMTLFSRLSGRVFSNVLERGDHPSEERACLTTEDLCFALVRWIVDIYHNTPHEGLGGLTPLQQWELDHENSNYPLHALPSREHRRLAFGVPLKRKLKKDGITIHGLRYHSEELVAWTLQHGFTEVDLRWDHADIGAISVHLDGRWHEVSAVHGNAADGHSFDGVSAAEWRAATNALKTRDQKRKLWDESVVFAALDEIQALNTRKQLAAGIVNTNWTAETFAAREAMYDGFKVGSTPKKVRQADDGFGRSIEPRAPLDQVPDAPAAADAPLTRKPKRGGKAPTMAFKE